MSELIEESSSGDEAEESFSLFLFGKEGLSSFEEEAVSLYKV
jgi:hypothetical protein